MKEEDVGSLSDEELANAGGVELTDEQMDEAAGGASDNYIHCPKCNSINLRYNDSKERYECNACKTAFTSSGIVKSGGCG